MPYHVTWAHETEVQVDDDAPRLRRVTAPSELPEALRLLAMQAA
jgi:hypothetical protein